MYFFHNYQPISTHRNCAINPKTLNIFYVSFVKIMRVWVRYNVGIPFEMELNLKSCETFLVHNTTEAVQSFWNFVLNMPAIPKYTISPWAR